MVMKLSYDERYFARVMLSFSWKFKEKTLVKPPKLQGIKFNVILYHILKHDFFQCLISTRPMSYLALVCCILLLLLFLSLLLCVGFCGWKSTFSKKEDIFYRWCFDVLYIRNIEENVEYILSIKMEKLASHSFLTRVHFFN